jgi:hypothetical protein
MNCTHVSTYGVRDRQCPRCKVLLRSSDFSSAGICAWCEWDLDEPSRLLEARDKPIKSPPLMISPAGHR